MKINCDKGGIWIKEQIEKSEKKKEVSPTKKKLKSEKKGKEVSPAEEDLLAKWAEQFFAGRSRGVHLPKKLFIEECLPAAQNYLYGKIYLAGFVDFPALGQAGLVKKVKNIDQ